MHGTAGEGVSAAGIVTIPHVAARGGLEERCFALVTRKLGRGGLACGQLEDIPRVGRVVEVSVEPPLAEVHVHERCDGAIVVRERLLGDVEAVHTGVKNG